MERTLDTTNMEQAKAAGVEHDGNPDQWVCIAKAWNKSEGWMKSTKVLEVPGVGCFLQVTTKEKDAVAEAVCWAPGVMLTVDRTGLVGDFGEEDVLEDFHFDVTQVADTITFHAVYRDSVVDNVSVSQIELRMSDDRLLDTLDPFLESVQRVLERDYDVEADKDLLVRSLLTAADSMRS